jgi:hypothetical protein
MTNNKQQTTNDKQQTTTLPGYQQALDDFGIIPLLQKLILLAPNRLDVEERESLAALLIEQLTSSLNSSRITQCLKAIQQGDGGVTSDLVASEFNALSSSIILTEDFPHNSPNAYFKLGDRVQWKPVGEPTDWGTVIGRFYAYAQHRCRWSWKYLIWLAQDSPSTVWTVADTAWEEDLQPKQ